MDTKIFVPQPCIFKAENYEANIVPEVECLKRLQFLSLFASQTFKTSWISSRNINKRITIYIDKTGSMNNFEHYIKRA